MGETHSTKAQVHVGCIVPDKSFVTAKSLCETFVARLSLAHPESSFVPVASGHPAEITLDIHRMTSSGMEGRIVQLKGEAGPLIGMAIADRQIGEPQIVGFIDGLIGSMQH